MLLTFLNTVLFFIDNVLAYIPFLAVSIYDGSSFYKLFKLLGVGPPTFINSCYFLIVNNLFVIFKEITN